MLTNRPSRLQPPSEAPADRQDQGGAHPQSRHRCRTDNRASQPATEQVRHCPERRGGDDSHDLAGRQVADVRPVQASTAQGRHGGDHGSQGADELAGAPLVAGHDGGEHPGRAGCEAVPKHQLIAQRAVEGSRAIAPSGQRGRELARTSGSCAIQVGFEVDAVEVGPGPILIRQSLEVIPSPRQCVDP